MDKLKVGTLGLRRGIRHLESFLRIEEVDIVGACDRFAPNRARAEEAIASAGGNGVVLHEYDDLLKLEPDAVVVASNGKMQVEHACQAMEAGCHVLSEIPGADSEDELVRLRDTVEWTGKTYVLGENACYSDFSRYWRKWVLDGRFGPISIAEGEYLHYLPQTLYLPDGSRLSPSEARAKGITDAEPIWRADQPPIQYSTHDLGPLLEVLDDRCVSVSCRSAPWRCREAPLRSDGQIGLFQTQKGTLIKILITLNTRRPSGHRYRLFGTDGGAEWFAEEKVCRRFDPASVGPGERDAWEVVPIGVAAPDDDATAGHGGTDLKMARHFVRTVLEGLASPIDVYRAIEYALPGILAARSANLGGMPIEIPDLRREPFEGTSFWETLSLPETEPPGTPYRGLA